MNGEVPSQPAQRALCLFLGALLSATLLARPSNPHFRSSPGEPGAAMVSPATFASRETLSTSTIENILSIPPGTILPVRLNATISASKSRPGQEISGRIMQDVPLTSGAKIREGSKVIGHVLEVTPATAGARARISLQFDKLLFSQQTVPINTNLRAIAGFMRVIEAQTPVMSAGESEVFSWLTTVQVGGDVVYGVGGPVTTSDGANQTVGRAVHGGVLVRVRAREGTKCRGAIDGNDSLQALWVFSSDACGTYGLEHVEIDHAGRTDPTGVIILASDRGDVKIPGGAGMLLRVNATGRN